MTGQRFAVGAALGLWVGDAALLALSRAGATWAQWSLGMAAAAFVSLTTALLVGGLVGPLVVPVVRELSSGLETGWVALRRGDAATRHLFLARVIALAALLAAWSAVTYHVVLAVVFGFARPETMAAGMTVADMVLAAVLLVAWRWAVRGGRWLVDGASRVRGLRWLVGRAWPVPALIALAVLAAATGIVAINRHELAQLPWREAIPLVALGLGVAFAASVPRAPLRVQRAALGIAGLVFAAGVVAAVRLRPESSTAQNIGFDRALSGRLGYAAWTFATDFDRDGQISVLGGGDCAPFDPERYTGAPDLPGNHIDEDCDGVDLSPQALRARPRMTLGTNDTPGHVNVLFVTVDALGGSELAAVGGRRSIMPRLDELASRSMLFTHCFSQGPSTRLSFPSIFTSRWDSQQAWEYSARMPYSFAEGERTLQDAFDDDGYETVAVIPNVYFDRSRWPSITKGFQRVDTSALSARTGKHNAREVTDAALRVLSEQRDRPLYMWVHYYDAHPPYAAPPGVNPPNKEDRTLYVEELGYLDRELGRLVDAIDHRPDPYYLVLTADHATSFHPVPEARRFHYGYDIYTSTIHVPLLFHGTQGTGLHTGRVEDVVSTMDVAPTLANLLRLNDKNKFEGTSLAWELLKEQSDPKRVTFHEFYLPENAFRGAGNPLELVSLHTDAYDLVLNRKRGTYELYAWPNDYYEQHDLYEEQARSPEVMHLRSLLGAFLQQYDRRVKPPESPGDPPKSIHSLRPLLQRPDRAPAEP